MYAINVLLTFNKSLAVKLRPAVSSFKQILRNTSKIKSSFSVKSLTDKDVVIYKYENSKYFTFMRIFSATQCICWSYLGVFLYELLHSTDPGLVNPNTFWGRASVDQRKYLTILCIFSVFFGWSVFITTSLYTFRSIRKIILHKGGKDLTIVTYALPKLNVIKIPLFNVSSFEHRTKVKKYIPIKLKNRYFYYLADVNGEFPNPELFDFTAGLKRSF